MTDWKNMVRAADLLKLIENWREQEPLKGTSQERDFEPVVKLFNPAGAATWLLTECDEDGLAFGLADLGFGTPELGYVSMDEIASVRIAGHIRIEQDLHFAPDKPLSRYAAEARQQGAIQA